MYTGAMAELAQQWLAGRLGDDLDVVVDSRAGLVAAISGLAKFSASASSHRPPHRCGQVVAHAVDDHEARAVDDASEVAAVADSHHRIAASRGTTTVGAVIRRA